jgi:hypothetical protein
MREGAGVDINTNTGILGLRTAFVVDLFQDGSGRGCARVLVLFVPAGSRLEFVAGSGAQ